jgi:hypothetical protein
MEVLLRDLCQEIIEAEAIRNRRFHYQLAILGIQANLSASAEANLLSQAARDPHPKTVSPFLDPCLHNKRAAIQGVYQLWAATASPPSL